VLQNNDRIAFGTNVIFLFMKKSDGKDIYNFEWEPCQAEIQSEIKKEKKKDRKKKIKDSKKKN